MSKGKKVKLNSFVFMFVCPKATLGMKTSKCFYIVVILSIFFAIRFAHV